MFKIDDIVVYREDPALLSTPATYKVTELISEDDCLIIRVIDGIESGDTKEVYMEDLLLWNEEMRQKIASIQEVVADLEKAFDKFSAKFRRISDISNEIGYGTTRILFSKLGDSMEQMGWSSSSLFC